ncbi:MAG TPA: sensor histidine kinase [Candidatus Dormibacteraeota bacterium]
MSIAPIVNVRELIRRALWPPIHDRRFWLVQGLVVAIAAGHELADTANFITPIGIPGFATVALFLVPIVYAALNFGITGSFATAAWVTLLTLPDFFVIDKADHHWIDGTQLAIIDAVAIFVGQRVERERLASRREAQRLTAYAANIVLAQEEERRRIGQEIHDEPLQDLIQLYRRVADAPDVEATAIVDELRESEGVLAATIKNLRDIARGLRPPALDDLGLVPALRRLTQEFGEPNALDVSFEVIGEVRRLEPGVELGAYRIAQQALHNVERHAAARAVKVRVNFGDRSLGIEILDDGIGFDLNRTQADSTSLGLLGMHERAQLLGGSLSVHSKPDLGTTVRAVLPVR